MGTILGSYKGTFIPEGLRVDQKYYSVVRMENFNLRTLFQAVEQHRANPHKMKLLIQHLYELMAVLERTGIVHGDIEPGNILVDTNRFVLIDYDLTTTPLSRPLASPLLGNRHMQHPKTKRGGPELNDRFSAWILFYSLKIIMLYPTLWNIYGAKPGRLLFHADDLKHPKSSQLFSMLRSHFNDEVRQSAAAVEQLCRTPPNEIPPLKQSFTGQLIETLGMTATVKSGKNTAIKASGADIAIEEISNFGLILVFGVRGAALVGQWGVAMILLLFVVIAAVSSYTNRKNSRP